MKEWRSTSQILFGFLPEQTADLAGRVWKVRDWRNPVMKPIDPVTLRREVIKAAMPWAVGNMDADYVKHLRQGRDLYAYALDRNHGVNVEEFPRVWMCRACNRVYFSSRPNACRCGAQAFGQLPFVGFHSCGELREPWVRACHQHNQVAIRLPGTASAAEIVFFCPECQKVLQKGLGFVSCPCGISSEQSFLKFNVHKASPVYTPQTVVIVNPPSADRAERLNEAGGSTRALTWALTGFEFRRADDIGLTREGLVRDLVSKGLSESLAKEMATRAAEAGELKGGAEQVDVPEPQREGAAAEAVTVAIALDESRVRMTDLAARADDPRSERGNVYRQLYPVALGRAGLEAVELVEKFPVLTGHFGYTRGGGNAGQGMLRAFQRERKYVVYCDVAETEALFVRLQPSLVARWLEGRGYQLDAWDDERSARLAILRQADVPTRGEERSQRSVGTEVLTLVHSYAHRLIRRLAVFAGIERNALSELVVPYHLGFFVYAAARGDFVLGGLQAVFEGELHHLLSDFAGADHRCPLDPGCRRVGSACMACLHLGEPSCRYFNRFLSRETLSGTQGFLEIAGISRTQVFTQQP